jgi:hypothetical protein
MKKVTNYLKRRWGIEKNYQIITILLMFSITGFTTLFTHKKIDLHLGIDQNTHILLKIFVFIFLILPIFMLYLYAYGNILGQNAFVSRFLKMKKDMLFSILPIKKR